ncbi:hypothetical protein C8T65DRAFT_706257 [Cerioporus squamosus]|nr:hypothetical protein C8T65DRAFT_706257 [Cerioporus squamosus]
MRRIAAVFASKRTDRSDAASSTAASAATSTDAAQSTAKPSSSKRFFRSLSRKSKPPVDPVVNRLSSTELHPPSSSSSSSGAPTTPDDDRGSLLRAPANKAWLSLPPVDPRLGSFHHLEPAPHDRTRFPVAPRSPATPSTLDTEDESSTEESSIAPDLPKAPERAVPLTAPAYLLALTSNNLRLPYAPPPLLHVPGRPMFPRSCNPRRSLPCSDSLETTMHRKKLQRRLHCGDLSPAEARSIAPFAGRRNAIKERLELHMDDVAVRVGRVRSHSVGLRRWVERPCFEDRTLVLLAENIPASPHSEPQWTRVAPATGFGVAALEFSMTLELLADLYEDNVPSDQHGQTAAPDASALGYLRLDTQLTLDLAPALTQSPTALSPSSSLSPAVSFSASTPCMLLTIPHSYRASPSPLRMEAASASPPTPSTAVVSPVPSAASTAVGSPVNPPSSAASPPPSASSPPPPPLKSALKQGVRFAEEEKEDQIPLGYVMRIKRKREEKARFLQAERERRKHEDERLRHEEEKRKWEEERAAWEREKRVMEEERKKRIYADERYGFGAMAGDGLATGQWDRNERPRPEREGSSSHSRTAYDPAAHPHMPRSNSDSSGSGSPADSRPNSVYGTGSAPGSRPPSMHSGQDVRSRERRPSGSGSRRGSMVSESGGSRRQSQHVPIPPLPAVWPMNMSPSMPMPMPMSAMPMGMPMQMPQMFGIGMDMPLLPPSPPFMMQQYGPRSPGQSSSRTSSPVRSQSSSPTLGRQNLPATGSSERVNRMSEARGSSASARAPPRPTRAHHQRTSSGDVPTHERRSSRAPAPSSSSSHRPPAASHSSSFPTHPPPAFPQARSSWGQPKTGFENISRPNSGRRQTMIS